MAYWTVSTRDKKSCEEREFWHKQDKTIIRVTGFRWGTFQIETSDDLPPEGLDLDNPDGVDMYSFSGDNVESVDLVSMDDGWYGDVEWPEDIPDDVKADLENIWEEDSYDGWESVGWIQTDTEAWLYGPLELTRESD